MFAYLNVLGNILSTNHLLKILVNITHIANLDLQFEIILTISTEVIEVIHNYYSFREYHTY